MMDRDARSSAPSLQFNQSQCCIGNSKHSVESELSLIHSIKKDVLFYLFICLFNFICCFTCLSLFLYLSMHQSDTKRTVTTNWNCKITPHVKFKLKESLQRKMYKKVSQNLQLGRISAQHPLLYPVQYICIGVTRKSNLGSRI